MRLNQMTLPVSAVDMAATRSFYEALGLTLIVHTHEAYARFETPTGETLSLHVVEGPLAPPANRAMIYFEVEDVDGVVAALGARGIAIAAGPKDQSWQWREARLFDPAGNPVCRFHAGENRRFPPWRRNSSQ